MRDFASCFSEHAIKVSDYTCSGTSSSGAPSVQNTVTCFYKSTLSTKTQLLVTVTWCRNLMGQALRVSVDDDPSCLCKVDTNSWQFWKKKGSRSLETKEKTKVDIYWDLSGAKYDASGPEPVRDFYLVVIADTEIALLLGAMPDDAAVKFKDVAGTVADFVLVGKKERVSGKATYSTKAQFKDHGASHDILIRCRGDGNESKEPELFVCIDQKRVVHVKKLQWKFRGNQTIFVDGVPVDMMWDVHDWFFNPSPSSDAVFLFRTRSGLQSRLWLEEKLLQTEKENGQFSLLIYARKSP